MEASSVRIAASPIASLAAALRSFLGKYCLIVAALACGFLNMLIERVAYRPLRNAPKLAPLITAVGFSFILENVGVLWNGGQQQSVTDLINSQKTLFSIGKVQVNNGDVL